MHLGLTDILVLDQLADLRQVVEPECVRFLLLWLMKTTYLGVLKQHRFISPQFHRWKVVSRAQLVSRSRPEKGQVQVPAGWPPPANFWEQSASSPLQNPVPGGCRIDIPFPCWLSVWGFLRSRRPVFGPCPQPAVVCQHRLLPGTCWTSPLFLLLTARRPPSF